MVANRAAFDRGRIVPRVLCDVSRRDYHSRFSANACQRRLAMEHNVAGIIVSNHGGPQVDGAVAAIDALPEVVKVTKGRLPVLFDSGIRTGADMFKALALECSDQERPIQLSAQSVQLDKSR